MGRKTKIAIVTAVALLVLGAVAAYAYDSSQDDKIADGVTVGGVDVGGMGEAEAKRAVRRRLLAPLRHSLRVGYDGESWVLPGKTLKLHADVERAVEEAVAESRDGGLPGRLVRYVTGDGLDEQLSADVTYSRPAVNRFVREVAEAVDREPQDATVEASGDSLSIVAGGVRAQAARRPADPPVERRRAQRERRSHDRRPHPLDRTRGDRQ